MNGLAMRRRYASSSPSQPAASGPGACEPNSGSCGELGRSTSTAIGNLGAAVASVRADGDRLPLHHVRSRPVGQRPAGDSTGPIPLPHGEAAVLLDELVA